MHLRAPFSGDLSGLGGFEHGIVDVEMTDGGCLWVHDSHTEALNDACNLLVFDGGDFGLDGGPKQGV